ncbi:MAG: S-layer homology domain-containing protein [Clostridia bacterium]|nr:S-layer homology domain-containing protein [Clostridia bacterium]
MKKRFAAALSVLIIWVLSFAAYAETNDTAAVSFSDVTPSDWFYADVLYAAEKGLLSGTGNGKFTPNGKTTRAMAVTVLWRLDGKPQAQKASFTDVKEGQYFFDAVSWASENKIVNGYDSTRFAPDDTVTREQIVSILFRYAGYKGKDKSDKADLGAYTDASQISAYAKDGMAWAVKAGLINGVSDALLAPKGTATRSQIAAIFVRFSKQLTPQNAPVPDNSGTVPASDGGAQSAGNETQASPSGGGGNNAGEGNNSGSTDGGNDPLAQKPQKTYEGVKASEAGKTEDNLFLLEAKQTGSGTEVTLTLCGKVKLCGFDIRVLYDRDELKLRELDTECGLKVYAHSSESDGSIAVNFADVNNIGGDKTVLKAVFEATNDKVTESVVSLKPVEIIMTDDQLETVNAPYTLTYCTITLS